MESTGLASYSPFNGRLGDFGTSGCLPYSSHTHRANGFSGCDGLSPPADLVNGKSSSNSTSKSTSSCTSGAFDEDFEVNEDEEVKTPRTSSPTLAELQKMLVTGSLCSKNSFSVPAGDFGKTELPNSVLKSFSLRPCQYPLERLYDESIPVKSFRRSLKEAKLLNSESHNLQRLESILPCLPSPLPRLTSYSSSSGSLIGDLHGLSFKPDDLVMSDTPVPSVLNSNRSDCMSLTRCSTDLKAEPSVMAGQCATHGFGPHGPLGNYIVLLLRILSPVSNKIVKRNLIKLNYHGPSNN
ncbi:unnamed protein product [Calicophoron daubneyi]|uniref:Uncharacterized protein n=1 Tax=Calicophoron daubneyi TaxID=300641 RepID=A0AAV2TX50_CALDB